MDTERLRRAHVTTMQLCNDRGYQTPYIELSKADFFERFGESPRASALDSVLLHEKDSSGMSPLAPRILDKLVHQGIRSGIIVTRTKLTPSAAKAVKEANGTGHFVQVFDVTELIVNITRHELVPKHIILTKEEKLALLEKYHLKEQQLPRMKMSDPVARYLGLKRGQVCKVIRNNSPTAGRYVSYRIVF
eukprot:gene10354-2489_t